MPRSNNTLFETHKPYKHINQIFQLGFQNISRYIEIVYAPLTENTEKRIRDKSQLLHRVDEWNSEAYRYNVVLVLFHLVNMCLNIDNHRDNTVSRDSLDTRVN